MNQINFITLTREIKGKRVRQLRALNFVPGNVFVAGGESVALKFPEKDFIQLYEEAGDTGLIYLQIDDDQKKRPTLIDEVQVDPVSGAVLHVSFKEVDLKEKIEAEVPVEVVGEFGVKEAVLVTVRNSIVVEALPTDLPEKFEVNIESLTEIGQMITLKDLEFDREKVALVDVETEEDWDKPVVLVQEQEEEIIEEVPEEEVEGEGGEGEEAEGVTEEGTDSEEKLQEDSRDEILKKKLKNSNLILLKD